MKFAIRTLLGLTVAFAAVGCGDDDDGGVDPIDAAMMPVDSGNTTIDSGNPGTDGGPTGCTSSVDVSAEITANTSWTADKCYVLRTHVFVRSPAVLTIAAGTKIFGGLGTSLVVTQGAKLMAIGTATNPIVFSSSKAPGMRRGGDWGGVVLLGRAPINPQGGTQFIEGFPATETRTVYGGTDPADSSGELRYVRIEFAGFELAPTKELNGLSCGGVGSGTVIDFVQVHMGSDDGIEMFGGTGNLKHIVISSPDDDGLDWDFGWTGKVQWLIIQQSPSLGDSGYEADNHPTDFDRTPRSMPTISNVTMVSNRSTTKNQPGMVIRRGAAARLSNHIVAFFSGLAADVRDTQMLAAGGRAQVIADTYIRSSIFFNNAPNMDNFPAEAQTGTPPADNDGNLFDEAGVFGVNATSMNRVTDPMLTDARNLTAPNFKPMAGSPALTGAAVPSDSFFDQTATYVGAIGATDWTTGWTAYPAN